MTVVQGSSEDSSLRRKGLLFDTDCHVHTYWSACAEPVTVEDYLLYARKAGLRCFAITDHSDDIYFEKDEREGLKKFTKTIDPSTLSGLLKERTHRLEKYLSDLLPHRKHGVRIGIELEQMPNGEFIFDWDYKKSFDVIIGSVHIIPSLKVAGPLPTKVAGPLPLKERVEVVQEEFLSLTMKALEQDINILAHPTRSLRKAGIEVPVHYRDIIIEKALSRGIALEVNAHSLDPDSTFVRRCLEKGAKLAFNTDSHSLKEFGDFSFHKLMLEEAGINGKKFLENCFLLE